MDKNVFITRFGELMVTMCEMQDVINRLSAENAELRALLPSEDKQHNVVHVDELDRPR